MPPAPTRTLSQILRSLASKDPELAGFLYPEAGRPRRGLYPEGTHKLAGAPVLTGTTVSDKATAAKLLQLARGLPKPEQNKVRELVKAILANQEARLAFASGNPLEIFAPQSNIARDLGRRNTVSKEQVLAALKETLLSPLYKGPSYGELLRMAGGDPSRIMLPPHVVRGVQRRLVSRAYRSTAREARARGEMVARPPQKARQRIMDPEEVIREMRETGEGAGRSGAYRPLLPPKKVEPGEASKTTRATLSDILPGLSFEARGGKMLVSWRGQDPVPISEAIKLTANEPYTETLFKGLLALEEKMRKLPTPAGREATTSQAKRMKAASRWVEDKDRPSGHVEYAPVAAEKRRETEGALREESAREERQSPADARAGLRRWRTGESGSGDQPKLPAKRASKKQVEFLSSLLDIGGEVTPRVQERLLKEFGENPLVAIGGLSGSEAAKYINRAMINRDMARTGGIPRSANISSEYGSKQRIAARNLIARTLEEAGQQRGAEGQAILAEALKKASKQEGPRAAAATALLGMRSMKRLGIDDAQAQLIDALLRQPGGERILSILFNR